MEFYLLTKEECDAICAKTDAFYRADRVVEGQNVAIYDYRLASLSDFVDNNAFELRGLTFVQNSKGEWVRHILMNKFFNVNQTIGWMYEDVVNKRITNVANKEDGSIISFVPFENGAIRAKSKTSFDSDQAKMAQTVYDNNEKLKTFIDRCIESKYTPIFEYVGPENQIVLEYQNTELILLQVRDNTDGKYVDLVNGHPHFLFGTVNENMAEKITETWGLKVAQNFTKDYQMNLDFLLMQKETNQEDIEGWIVTFDDGQMAKIKTNKYLSLHGLIGPDAFRENLLVKTIIDGNIDDVISALVPGEKKDRIVEMTEKVDKYFNHSTVEFVRLYDEFHNKYKKDRKRFAMEYAQKHPLFGSIMKAVNVPADELEKVAEKAVYEHIERATNSLGKAKDFVAGL